MAVDYYSYNHNEHKVDEEEEGEDDYIDMEVSTFANLFSYSRNTILSSPQHPREFEFQMSSTMTNNVEIESTTSPADELFYMGKLLPLHLPPRLQMVEKLLQDSTPKNFNEFYSTPLGTNTATTPTANTPFESCNISPAESCQVSRELNPEDYHKEFFGDNNNNVKKSWTKKLKIKLKSLFGKSSDEVCSSSAKVDDFRKSIKKNPCSEVSEVVSQERFDKKNDTTKEVKICHRRSFSGAFKRRSSATTTKLSTSSSSSSSSSNASMNQSTVLNDLPFLKRSSSANSEIETSLIQGAIAHCKQSSKQVSQSQKTLSEVGCHSFPSSRFSAALDDQTSLCRG
ncbi:probable membrane-associated kinase regulator 4 [Beta vulgaris subsp. vulgaris]|uniref:probable membrane-associated kinase regulator 4 n=1 Tax=Beta vulgaris subsp. vulgaris TaxID=3555 RepID=UPI0020370705|nr:probable membrane-associated kinase regulator 4 [Beta vulgaris subsp. vulgaris]